LIDRNSGNIYPGPQRFRLGVVAIWERSRAAAKYRQEDRMNREDYDIELCPHHDDPDRVHLQLCLPSATAAKIMAAMEASNDDLAVAATIWALRVTN
jgi:hypothetical protein